MQQLQQQAASAVFGNMFGDDCWAKLAADPKTAEHLKVGAQRRLTSHRLCPCAAV
jgi:hypothetical protein